MSRVTVTLLSLATTAMRVSKSLRELLERHRPRNLTLRSVNLQDADAMPSSLSLLADSQPTFNIVQQQPLSGISSNVVCLSDSPGPAHMLPASGVSGQNIAPSIPFL
jgi:hypothetical protein